jgi:Cu2+-containing amine oxidase
LLKPPKPPNGDTEVPKPNGVREIRTISQLWKDGESSSGVPDSVHGTQFGEELVLWLIQDAYNYSYIVSYSFQADGTILFRIAATAKNLEHHPLMTHLHAAIWRVDIDLNGYKEDRVFTYKYTGTHDHSTDMSGCGHGVKTVAWDKEGYLDWNPNEFTELWIGAKTLKNDRGVPVCYDLRPTFRGIVRREEPFMQHDFWVTRTKPGEMSASLIDEYFADQESVKNTNIAVWLTTPLLHIARNEDGYCEKPGEDGESCEYWVGETTAMWGGFDLRPRNLFAKSPFFTPNP